MTDNLFDIRHAIQEFLETKLNAQIEGAGISLNEPNRMADIEAWIDEDKYMITIEEL
jgi:hypothetical protein